MKALYLEEMNGIRSLIATDGETHWWVVPFEDGAEYYEIDIYGGTLDEVKENILDHIDIEAAIDEILDNEEWFNPAWDRFTSLDEAEQHEISVIGEDVSHRYVTIG